MFKIVAIIQPPVFSVRHANPVQPATDKAVVTQAREAITAALTKYFLVMTLRDT
ncbi:hypothetical protein [Paraburkholderia kururiensis]|uniref:hypothetical protein n=1 Tax=Paraburkholderia kururiensis TaxID=984307 RepID=UPI0018F2B91F|nr:hypothetical protein [Paraburkholderia kururiensis]